MAPKIAGFLPAAEVVRIRKLTSKMDKPGDSDAEPELTGGADPRYFAASVDLDRFAAAGGGGAPAQGGAAAGWPGYDDYEDGATDDEVTEAGLESAGPGA